MQLALREYWFYSWKYCLFCHVHKYCNIFLHHFPAWILNQNGQIKNYIEITQRNWIIIIIVDNLNILHFYVLQVQCTKLNILNMIYDILKNCLQSEHFLNEGKSVAHVTCYFERQINMITFLKQRCKNALFVLESQNSIWFNDFSLSQANWILLGRNAHKFNFQYFKPWLKAQMRDRWYKGRAKVKRCIRKDKNGEGKRLTAGLHANFRRKLS